MIILILPFAVLWTVCAAKQFQDYYYQSLNVTRTTPVGIAAYRSALTLDWMAAEDSRQRELVSAFEHEPQFPSPISHSDCISYNRPTAGNVAKLMLEVLSTNLPTLDINTLCALRKAGGSEERLHPFICYDVDIPTFPTIKLALTTYIHNSNYIDRNLEGDDGSLIANLVKSLVRAKLLMLETSMFENEPDFDALVKTPTAMIGEPHTTFPRIIQVLWMAITDPSTVKKHGWCTVHKMTSFIQASRPLDIAKNMRASEQIISRARFIMEEFIQHVTPLNMEKSSTKSKSTTKPNPPTPLPPIPSALDLRRDKKRPVRTHPEIQMKIEDIDELPTPKLNLLRPTKSTTTTEEMEPLPEFAEDSKPEIKPEIKALSFSSGCAFHQTFLWPFIVLPFLY